MGRERELGSKEINPGTTLYLGPNTDAELVTFTGEIPVTMWEGSIQNGFQALYLTPPENQANQRFPDFWIATSE